MRLNTLLQIRSKTDICFAERNTVQNINCKHLLNFGKIDFCESTTMREDRTCVRRGGYEPDELPLLYFAAQSEGFQPSLPKV